MLPLFGGNNQLESLKLNFYDGSTSEFLVNVNILWELWKCALLDAIVRYMGNLKRCHFLKPSQRYWRFGKKIPAIATTLSDCILFN